MTTSRGSRPWSALAIACRASETMLLTRSVIGISSSNIAGGMSGRTSVMRRSSVRLNMGLGNYALKVFLRQMLHVTNGDMVIRGFKAGQIPGVYLAWVDPLHDGPVPETSSLEELSDVRARALADFGWGSYSQIRQRFSTRDQTL